MGDVPEDLRSFMERTQKYKNGPNSLEGDLWYAEWRFRLAISDIQMAQIERRKKRKLALRVLP